MATGADSGSAADSSDSRSDRPRDAATLILIDQATGTPRVLMGRRHADQVFLPNKYVFPGGRVDRADGRAPSADELRPSEAARLLLAMRGEPSSQRCRALALAAIRETFEETGLLIGTAGAAERTPDSEPWRAFLSHGVVPRLSGLTYLARAITPPGRPRRYDTRFFMADARAIAHRVDVTDGELSRLDWFSIEEMRSLDLPGITRVIIEDLSDRLASGTGAAVGVPFYFYRNGAFEREMLTSA